MPRKPRRSRQPAKAHVDRYAPKAARSQAARQELDAKRAREHPTIVQPPSTEQEDEEASA